MAGEDKLTAEKAAELADAQIAKANAEARKANAEAQHAESTAKAGALELEAMLRTQKVEDAHVYQFSNDVNASSVATCLNRLRYWAVNDPGCDIEIVFNSPGGSVIDGLALFDYIQELRRAGHRVVTSTRGMAASMGGVLLQAGDWRVMGREAHILIHEVAFRAGGKIGEVEDQVTFSKMLQDRIINIFVARSKMTAAEIRRKWARTDWWIGSELALKLGLVDEVR